MGLTKVPLAEVCTIVGGGTPRRSNAAYFNGTIPWATPTDVTGLDSLFIKRTKEGISEIGLSESSARLLPTGTVLMTSRATIGYTAIATQPMATNQGFANLICSERIVPEYLAYWLRNQRERLIQLAGGTTFREIPKSTLKKVCIPLPPLAEQRRIVDILNRAAKIERLRQQAQALMREFIPALFVKMFGDPATNPMGWEETQVCNLGTVGSGAGFPKKEQGIQGEEIPFLKVSDMNLPGNEIAILSWNNTISNTTRERLGAKLFPAGSVIFPKIGAAIATNKKRILTCPSCVDNNVMTIIPDTTSIHSEYLYGIMLQKNIGDFASTSDPPSMRKTTVENWYIINPPLFKQSQYAEIVESAYELTIRTFSASRAAESLSYSLMHKFLKADK